MPEMACWMVTGERQAARIRSLYLKAILRQDIGFFDKEAKSGEIVGRMSGDTVLIQGEKVIMMHPPTAETITKHSIPPGILNWRFEMFSYYCF